MLELGKKEGLIYAEETKLFKDIVLSVCGNAQLFNYGANQWLFLSV